jgi:hypothetical protein
VKLQLLSSGQLTQLQSTSVVVVAGEPQAVTAATVVGSWDASGSLVHTSSKSAVRSTSLRSSLLPPCVGFGLLLWSIAGYNVTVVKLSRLSEPHAMGANFLLPYISRVGFRILASRFSVSMETFSQVNPRRKSLQDPRSAYWLSTLFWDFVYLIMQYTFWLHCHSRHYQVDGTLRNHTDFFCVIRLILSYCQNFISFSEAPKFTCFTSNGPHKK